MRGGLGIEMGVLKKEGEMKIGKGKKRRGLSHVGEIVGGANSLSSVSYPSFAKGANVISSCYEKDTERLRHNT